MLTHGLPIKSILFQIVRISRSLIKSSYLKNKKHFLGLLFHIWILHQILNIFKQKKIVIANVFPKLATVQGLVTPLTIQRRLKTSFNSQHVKRFQTLVNLHESTFTIFFRHCEEKSFGKDLPGSSLKSYGCLLTHGLPITSILF